MPRMSTHVFLQQSVHFGDAVGTKGKGTQGGLLLRGARPIATLRGVRLRGECPYGEGVLIATTVTRFAGIEAARGALEAEAPDLGREVLVDPGGWGGERFRPEILMPW